MGSRDHSTAGHKDREENMPCREARNAAAVRQDLHGRERFEVARLPRVLPEA